MKSERFILARRIFVAMKQWVEVNGQVNHVHRLRVRYADTDRMDMVYHGTYAAYLEAARVEMLRDLGWVYAELEKAGTLLPVVQLNLAYKSPARYDEELDILTHVLDRPTSRLKLHCTIQREDVLLVSAEVTLVFVDAKTGRPVRAPEEMVEDLLKKGLVRTA